MPTVKRPAVLAAVYEKVRKKIEEREIPTLLVDRGQLVYRSINPTSPHTSLPKPAPGGHVSKIQANKLLIPGDGARELNNRFSGPSHNPSVPPAAGLYCVLQQQALVNESIHYSHKVGKWALAGRCVLTMQLMGSMLVAELSPHNPRAKRFFRELGSDIWDQMVDPADCSVARGIGLAVAHSGFLRGLSVETVRDSERSPEERGDNFVLLTEPGKAITGVFIDQAAYYGNSGQPEVFPVAFP